MIFALALQIVSSLQPAGVDTTAFATKADVAAVQAQVPQPATAVPPSEQVGGAVGSSTRYRRMDDVAPRITRAGFCVTGVGGTCTITWSTPLAVAPNVILEPVSNGPLPVDCNTVSLPTITTVAIKCWTAQAVTVSVLGAIVSPFTTAAAGITVQATAIPPTQ